MIIKKCVIDCDMLQLDDTIDEIFEWNSPNNRCRAKQITIEYEEHEFHIKEYNKLKSYILDDINMLFEMSKVAHRDEASIIKKSSIHQDIAELGKYLSYNPDIEHVLKFSYLSDENLSIFNFSSRVLCYLDHLDSLIKRTTKRTI